MRPGAVPALIAAGALLAAACGTSRPVPVGAGDEAGTVPPGEVNRPPSRVASAADEAAVEAAVEAYGQEPTTDRALALVAEIQGRGDVDHGPYLVDLLRMTGSSLVREAAVEALSGLRGGAPARGGVNKAYVELGSWVLDQEPDPGPRYPSFKAALYGAVDPGFRDLLEQVEDTATLVGLQWGGVPVGGIVELNRPVRIDPVAADWSKPDELVYAVAVAGQTVGYPRRVIGRHELANDETVDPASGGRVPFGVSYCSLCRTAVAFDRRVGGRELSFLTSGLLLNANKVMVDNETRTLWQQATGQAIAGPLAGRQLDLLPIQVVGFADLTSEPGATVLDLPEPFIVDRETGTLVTYPYADSEPLADYLADGRLWFPVVGVAGEPDPLEQVATVVVGDQALAVDLEAIEPDTSTVVTVGTTSLLLVADPSGPRLFDVTRLDDAARARLGLSIRDGSAAEEEGGVELATGREAWFSWRARHPTTARWPERN